MGWCILCCVAQSDVLSLLYWCRDLSMRDVTCVFSVFAVIGFGPCRCCRWQSVFLAMVRNWLQDRREPLVVMSTYLFFPYKLKITICRRVYLHSNLGLDSDDVQWDKLFTEWQILLNCSLISLSSSHDLKGSMISGLKFLPLGKCFIDILCVGRISKENLWQTSQRKLNIVPLFLWTKNATEWSFGFKINYKSPYISGLSIWHSSRSLEC